MEVLTLALGGVASAAVATAIWSARRARRGEREQASLRERLAERALDEQRASTIVEHMPVMMNAIGPDGVLVAWNKECERVSGFTAAEMIGNPLAVEKIYPDPAYRAEVLAEARRLDYQYRGWIRRYATKDGGERYVSTSSISREHPLPGWKAWGVAIDVTERIQAERRLRLLTDSIPALIAYIERTGVVGFCNSTYTEWFGRAEDDVLQRHAREVFGEATWLAIESHLPAALAGESCTFELELPGSAADQRPARWVSVNLVPHTSQERGGEVTGMYLLMTDMTRVRSAERERQRLEGQLRQSQKMEAIGQLASGVAHDFRNILTVISAHTERVKSEVVDNNAVLESVESMEEAVEQAATMTRSLLAFSRKLATVKRPVNLCRVVHEARRMLRRTLPASIQIDLGPEPTPEPWVHADETQLQQVVLNLALNARDAMPEGGVLRLCVEEHGDRARLVVADTGTGIAPEVLPRIFEPFFTTKAGEHGTGLGLATVHGIVTDHEGTIDVESSRGTGSVFTIELPVHEPVDETEEPVEPPPAPAGRGETILLVEDNDQIRQIITASLMDCGYEILRIGDGLRVREVIREHPGRIDLLLMDVDLPGRSGLDVLADLRREGQELPVLLITGNTEASVAERLNGDSRASVLFKPFKMSDLTTRIHRVLHAPVDEGAHR